MSSPDVFRSSPLRPTREFNSETINSSSPDLPSIRDLASQIPRRPPLRSGSKAKPIPEGAISTFTSAKEQWKSVQAAAEKDEPADPVVEVPPETSHKPKKTRKKPVRTKKTDVAVEAWREPSVDEPWKKYKASPKSKSRDGNADGEGNNKGPEGDNQENEADVKARKETGVMSEHFQSHQDAAPRAAKKTPDNEPLQLEPAMERRVDWTPPAAKAVSMIDLASDTPEIDDNTSSVNQAQSGVFKTLLETYGCDEQAPQPVTVSDEDSSFLKKRKLVELVSTNDTSRPTSPAPEKSPTKQKAPKKKARTITDLATAAYRPAAPLEPEPAASVSDHLPVTAEVPGQVNNEENGKVKGKGKANVSKKKAPKKSRKKQPPPKPILLSPSTALKEVSKQDFVFGTSSQLMREQSPTLLRDIQNALKQSAEIDEDTLPAPLNSDAAGPVEQQKLWKAGARDEDGQLFDAKIVDLIDDTPEAFPVNDDPDPFGYVKADSESRPLPTDANADNSFETLSDIMPSPSRDTATNKRDASPSRLPEHDCNGVEATVGEDSFETLSDVLPDLRQRSPEMLDDDVPLSSSQVSVSTNFQTSKGDANAHLSVAPPSTANAPSASADPALKATNSQVQPPKYDLYTDVQLSREITSFGFKPVKKRTAMLALLDQCWKSKTAMGGTVGARSVTTSAKSTSGSAQSKKSDASPTRPRGRPRKNSESAKGNSNTAALSPESLKQPKRRTSKSRAGTSKTSEQMNEPPPSAQPVESPKRGRGRPRKNSPSPSLSSPSKPVTKKPRASKTTTAPRPKAPTKKPTVSKTVVEIPDSASEDGSRSSVSRSSSPEQTFSPPPEVDLSVSMEEDTELSLSMTPDEKEAALYNSLTAAITSAPRSTDPANPSWHEKILLYDPIVLEDITSWLNSGQLTRVGYDGEVSPGEVKKWCESKSVCCLWRVNLRGKERKRY